MNKPNVSEIGKYINLALWSDVEPIGKIIGINGSKYVVQRIKAARQTKELKWEVGGFAGHCVNQNEQEWEFELGEQIEEIRILKKSRMYIANHPHKHYDYNF